MTRCSESETVTRTCPFSGVSTMLGGGGDDRFKVALAVLLRLEGDRDAAIGLLGEVVASAANDRPLVIYAASLATRYAKDEE